MEQLSKMEDTRIKKEKALKSKALTTPVILFGIISMVAGFLTLGFTGIIMDSQGSSTTPGLANASGDAVCVSASCVLGLLGILLIIAGGLKLAGSYRKMDAEESKLQAVRSQLITLIKQL